MFPVLFVCALVQAHDARKHDQDLVVACGCEPSFVASGRHGAAALRLRRHQPAQGTSEAKHSILAGWILREGDAYITLVHYELLELVVYLVYPVERVLYLPFCLRLSCISYVVNDC